MIHYVGWMCIGFLTTTFALPALSSLVLPRPRGERHPPVRASVWAKLLLSPVWFIIGAELIGHPGPGWLRWLLLPLAAAATAFLCAPGIMSRRKAGLPWWRFWTDGPSSATLGSPEDSPETVAVPDAETLIHRISNAQFSTTRLRPGYDEEEVDKFLDKLIADLSDCGRLDPARVRDVKFTQTRLRPGYTEEDVDAFLDEVTAQAAR
jgi:DivIVA domain-containing protein